MSLPYAHPTPNTSLMREFVEAFFTLFVGVFLLIGRGVRLLFMKARRAVARRTLFEKAVAMGTRMEHAGAGDELLLQKVRAGADPKRNEKDLATLGEMGLEPGVPLLGLEEDYQAGHDAYRRCRQAELDHDAAAYRLLPHSALGWFALLSSFVITPLAALLLFAFCFPNRVPASLARFVGRAPVVAKALPEADFGSVKVEVVGARIGRAEVEIGQGGKAVVDETPAFHIKLKITNGGGSAVDYQSWRGKFSAEKDLDVFARVNDDRGAAVGRLVFPGDAPPKGGVRQASVAPGESVEDILVFGRPEPGFARLDIFLPGHNIGAKGQTRQLTLTPDQIRMPEAAK